MTRTVVSQARVALYFLLAGSAWGVGFLFIRISIVGVTPLQFVFARTLIAALVLSGVMLATKRAWPKGIKAWLRISILSIFGMFLPFLLYAFAGETIPSALSAMYNAAVPVSTALLTIIAMRQEKLNTRKLLAIAIGAMGIVFVLAPWNLEGANFDLKGQLYAIAAVLLLGFAFSYTRKSITPLKLDPVGVAAGQVIVTMVLSGVLLPFTDMSRTNITAPIIWALLAIGVTSTGFAYVWNFVVIDQWGAASASMVTYLTTVVGVLAGLVFAHEQIALNQVLGVLVVLLGVAVGITKTKNSAPLD